MKVPSAFPADSVYSTVLSSSNLQKKKKKKKKKKIIVVSKINIVPYCASKRGDYLKIKI